MPPLILGIHAGQHDAAAAVFEGYSLKAAVQLERLTRKKGDGPDDAGICTDEVLSIIGASRRDVDAIGLSRETQPARYFRHFRGWRRLREFFRTHVQGESRRALNREIIRVGNERFEQTFDFARLRRDCGFREGAELFFYNHHEAHALPALFYTDWDDALLITADGGGDTVNYSHRHFANGNLKTIYGGDECLAQWEPVDSLGQAYAAATEGLGFVKLRHEGKVTGLSAMGDPIFAKQIAARFWVDDSGRVFSNFRANREMFDLLLTIAKDARREDVAASIQKVLEDVMMRSIRILLERNPSRHLGVSGGIFANVRLNRVLAQHLPIDRFFVFPAMGDDGLPVGAGLSYLLKRDGLSRWLRHRKELSDLYLGRDYTSTVDDVLAAMPGITKTCESPVEGAVRRLASGRLGAIYTGRMEFGPRALGARSILANPAQCEMHDILNRRLNRTEFMPFAPVVAADRAADVFDIDFVNAYACRFMTITCNVRPYWRDKIPAVVHVDGSARPQTIERDSNPLYFDILKGFESATGLPVLINTSLNVHEEPIVNRPTECGKALVDNRIDFVVTGQAIYERSQSTSFGESSNRSS